MNSKDYFLEYKNIKAAIAAKTTEVNTLADTMHRLQLEIVALERQGSEVAALGMAKFEEETQ
jgi:hypothetical protein